jgi:hypothetical protein
VCDPVTASFALQAAGSVAKYQGQVSAVKQRNRARLRNFELANEEYLTDVMLRENDWKNSVQDTEIELDNIYQNTIDQWNRQDAELDKFLAAHSTNVQRANIAMYRQGYAGEQAGVTAGRLAAESVRAAGRAKAESMRSVMLNLENVETNKEVIKNQADFKQRQAWEQTRWAPIHGPTPPPPQLEAKPAIGGMLMEIAIAGAGAYMQGTQLANQNKILQNQADLKAAQIFAPSKNVGDLSFRTQSLGDFGNSGFYRSSNIASVYDAPFSSNQNLMIPFGPTV